MSLLPLFDWFETVEATHVWNLACHDPADGVGDQLAKALAQQIMEQRCRACPHHLQAWKLRFEGGPPPPSTSEAALIAFIRPVFGIPDEPIPADHLEGFVAMQLWYFLTLEAPSEQIVRVEAPGFSPTDPGGDGLVIHRVPAGYLMFRLWEIKKCTGKSDVADTVNTAYGQLRSRATEYLARYTAVGQELDNGELKEFYGQLIDFWVEAQPQAAAGVAVSSSLRLVPTRCFTTFGDQFPGFVSPVRLRGILSAVGDFPTFALKVRDYVWTGL